MTSERGSVQTMIHMGFNTASGMRSHVTESLSALEAITPISFNTASGMRSHVTGTSSFQYLVLDYGFNTASGMRSHVTIGPKSNSSSRMRFQYRKRYEVTCDDTIAVDRDATECVSIPQAV